MLMAIQEKDPELVCVYSKLYTGNTTHRATKSSAEYEQITATSGVDQGCTLAAFGFAAAVGPTVQQAITHIRANKEPGAFMMTYLDDGYVWVVPEQIKGPVSALEHATGSIGLELQTSKTQNWLGNCKKALDHDMHKFVTPRLNCLGGTHHASWVS